MDQLQVMLQDGNLEEDTRKDINLLLSQQAVSFLQFSDNESEGFEVNVHKQPPTDPMVYQLIEGLESDRQKIEDQVF